MNQFLITSYSILIGLTPLIPIPVLDDLVKGFFYKDLVRSLASSYGLALSDAEVSALAEDRGQGCLNGCVIGAVEYLVKRLVRKIIFVLEWRRTISLVTHTYYVGHLMDHAFRKGWYKPGDVGQAMRLRAAIEQARGGANTNLVRRVVQTSFDQSRTLVLDTVQKISYSLRDIALRRSRVWLRRLVAVRLRQRAPGLSRWLYRRLRPSEAESAQVAEVESAVAQALEHESPGLKARLAQLVARLQDGLGSLPAGHFEALEERLKNALKPTQEKAT